MIIQIQQSWKSTAKTKSNMRWAVAKDYESNAYNRSLSSSDDDDGQSRNYIDEKLCKKMKNEYDWIKDAVEGVEITAKLTNIMIHLAMRRLHSLLKLTSFSATKTRSIAAHALNQSFVLKQIRRRKSIKRQLKNRKDCWTIIDICAASNIQNLSIRRITITRDIIELTSR
jgi:hypothetical protein